MGGEEGWGSSREESRAGDPHGRRGEMGILMGGEESWKSLLEERRKKGGMCEGEGQVRDVPMDGGRTYTGSQLFSLVGPSHQLSFVSYQIVVRNTKSGLKARC